MEELLTIEEIAAVLRTKKGWVYGRTRLGQAGIPHIKLGKQLRFEKEKVLKFFQDEATKVTV